MVNKRGPDQSESSFQESASKHSGTNNNNQRTHTAQELRDPFIHEFSDDQLATKKIGLISTSLHGVRLEKKELGFDSSADMDLGIEVNSYLV